MKKLMRTVMSFLLMVIVGASLSMKLEAGGATDVRVTALLYHHLLEAKDMGEENGSIISVEAFESHMKYLHDHGYTTVTLKQLYEFLYEGGYLPPKSVVITFDDGYLSNFEYAYPILKKYNMQAAIFPVTANLKDTPTAFSPIGYPRPSLRELLMTSDVFEYGSHTHSMHNMVEGKADLLRLSEESIRLDLKISHLLTGSTPYFAYPFGAYNERTIQLLKEEGFKMAFTVRHGKITRNSNPFELNRYPVYPGYTADKIKSILEGK